MTPMQLNVLMTAPGARCPIDWNDDNLIKKFFIHSMMGGIIFPPKSLSSIWHFPKSRPKIDGILLSSSEYKCSTIIKF